MRPLTAINPGAALDDLYRYALGFQTWNYNPLLAGGNAASLTSQTVYSVLVPAIAETAITGVGLLVTTAAVGTAPTGVYVGISDQKTMLAVSGNLASLTTSSDATANWTSTGLKQMPLSLSQLTYQIPSTGIYYVHILINGTFGTTQPQFGRGGPNVSATGITGGNLPGGTAGTGQTTLTAGAGVTIVSTNGLNLFAGLV